MKNCSTCIKSIHTTAQTNLAKDKGISVDWLPYVYCTLGGVYTTKESTCVNYKPKPETK